MSASFPNSVKSFATRSAGQAVGSAHINDLQDEVSAIETALLNGVGTWTPVLAGSGGTTGQTYSTQTGRYVKIGRLVMCWGRITLTAKGTITGTVQITGLPFLATTAADGAMGTVEVAYFANLGSSWASINGLVGSGSQLAALYGSQSLSGVGTLTTADISDTTDMLFSINYLAAS